MAELKFLLEGIQQTQTLILTRLDRIERVQSEATVQHEALADAAKDLGLKVDALRLPILEPALHRLLGTTELLEEMLSYLSFYDLLRAQRVSKRFNAVIHRSLQLQRALFFTPDSADQPLRWNPAFAIFDVIKQRNLMAGDLGVDGGLRVMPESPQFESRLHHVDFNTTRFSKTEEDGSGGCEIELDVAQHLCPRSKWLKAHYGREEYGWPCTSCMCNRLPGGSWERMLLMQPPQKIIWNYYADRVDLSMSSGNISGRYPADTRIGEMFAPRADDWDPDDPPEGPWPRLEVEDYE
ncbi:hypothetical protein LTR85_009619 [Meristemomyces frigidus]|nr:hypothetical protein LTR85_009619 [Meristemomyces frigidus]